MLMEEQLILFKDIFEYQPGGFVPKVKSLTSISPLFSFLFSKEGKINLKNDYLNRLIDFIKEYRFLSEYFSSVDNTSIYIVLINLFLLKETDESLKSTILKCIDLLIINIQTPRTIFEYIYQKIALLYRKRIDLTQEAVNNYLILLKHFHGETVLMQKPRNYFAFSGNGSIQVDTNERHFSFGYSITFGLSFKIGVKIENDSLQFTYDKCTLIQLMLSNNQCFTVELEYPFVYVRKYHQSKYIMGLPSGEWINLIIVIESLEENKTGFTIFVNGEKQKAKHIINNCSFNPDDLIQHLSFFDGFIGEVSSVIMFSQKEKGSPGILSKEVLEGLGSFSHGISKKSQCDSLYILLKNNLSVIPTSDSPKKKFYMKKKPDDNPQKSLLDDLLFVLTPYTSQGTLIEYNLQNLTAKLTGFARSHCYHIFQKRVNLLGGAINLLPIAEMLLLNQSILTEEIFYNYLVIIYTILKDRKYNMKIIYTSKFFSLLSLFIEKFPIEIFTEKILMEMLDIAKIMFSETVPELPSVFFEHILLNEKILSKYSQTLQIKFWNEIIKFCQSDITQIESLMNMKKICLILRYYDETKYYEMCCDEHYEQLKSEYAGKKLIMSPTMSQKLSHLKQIMILLMDNIANPETSDNISILFSLLTLDLSPCLSKFIVEIFISAIQTKGVQIAENLFKNNFNSILCNTFQHSLLEERILMLNLIYKLSNAISSCQSLSFHMSTLEKMLKACLMPGKMFYIRNDYSKINKKYIKDLASHCAMNLGNDTIKDKCKNNSVDNTIVFIDKQYQSYLSLIFIKLLNWVIGQDFEATEIATKTLQTEIVNLSILELLISFNDQRNNIQSTISFLRNIQVLITIPVNCKKIRENKVIMGWLLDNAYNHFKNNSKNSIVIYDISSKMFVEIIIQSILLASEEKKYQDLTVKLTTTLTPTLSLNSAPYPILALDNLFIWGNKIRKSENEVFLCDFIFTILNGFSNKLYPLITPFILPGFSTTPQQSKHYSINENFFIFCTMLFYFYCLYRNEPLLKNTQEINPYETLDNIITLPSFFYSGMNCNSLPYNSLEGNWKDLPLFSVINKHFSFIWSNENTFKVYGKKLLKNRMLKYETIINEIVLNKNTKDCYLHELLFLCKEVIYEKKEIEMSLVKLFSISYAMIIHTVSTNSVEDNEVWYWLKEYKHFIRFLILSSTNITATNQDDLYEALTNQCQNAIAFSICFLKEEYKEKVQHKAKFRKVLTSILTLGLLIVRGQSAVIESNSKGFLGISYKQAKSDTIHCAIYKLFNEIAVDSSGQPALSLKKLRDQNTLQFMNVADEMMKPEWKKPFFCNQLLKKQIENSILSLASYNFISQSRNAQIVNMRNEINLSYQREILSLVPSYEFELEKYSNNSFIIQKEKRNQYKKIKKKLFGWRGMWSDYTLFFRNDTKLKMKMINHYTKSLTKPFLAPILDLNYYIPKFTEFTIDQMFRDSKQERYQYDLDIDKIIRSRSLRSSIELKTNTNQSNGNYLKEIYRKSNEELANLYSKINSKFDFTKDAEFIDIFQKTSSTKVMNDIDQKKSKYYYCCFVKPSHHIKGVLFIEKKELIFRVFMNQEKGNTLVDMNYEIKEAKDEDFDEERNTCFGSFFTGHHKDKDLLTFTLQYDNIKFFLRKRYYYKKTGIEIFTVSNKSYYFNFKKEEDREQVIAALISTNKEPKPIRNDLKDTKDDYDYVMGYEISRNKNKKIRLSDKVNKWCEWEISTLELLMWLNIYSNRSFSDLSQYPVMPWILKDYSESITVIEKDAYRDLSLPMGMLELSEKSIARKEQFLETFESMKAEEEEIGAKPYFFGSHYSNPIYVANFLMRIFPFSHISVELQGHKFDNPDRLFLSVDHAFTNSTTMKTDLRELIPEFFYLPEIFKNINNLSLGVLETGKIVNNVETPCKNNPYEFVLLMREAIESSFTSFSIQKWIDLIFGYKQRGKEAELAQNLFISSSYEDQINIETAEDKFVLFHLVEFGLTPGQSITRQFPSRNQRKLTSFNKEITCDTCNLTAYLAKSKSDKSFLPSSKVMICSLIERDYIIALMSNNIVIVSKVGSNYMDKKYSFEITRIIPQFYKLMDGKIGTFYNTNDNIRTINNHLVIYNKGKNIALGGFYDGKIAIFSLENIVNKIIIKITFDQSPVTSISIDKEEEFAFCGNQNGNVNIFKINNDSWRLWKQIIDHSAPITHIFCSDELNIWASSSADGYVNIYTMPYCRIIRSIYLSKQHLDYVFISACSLPSIIIYSSSSHSFHVYSLNGEDLKRDMNVSAEHDIKSPIILKDLFFNEYLAYIIHDTVIIRSLPFLFPTHNVEIKWDLSLSCLIVSEDNKTLYGVCNDGNGVVVICNQEEISEMAIK